MFSSLLALVLATSFALPNSRASRRAWTGSRPTSPACDRLGFIRNAQTAGLTIAEIAGIIHLRDDGTIPCSHVKVLLDAKLADVQQRLHQLTALRPELQQLVRRGRALDPADCTIDDICHILRPSVVTR